MNYENDFGTIVYSEVNNRGPYWCTRKNTNDHAAKSVWLLFSGSYNFSSQILIVRFLDCLHSLVSQQRGTVSSLLCWHLLRKTHLKMRNNSGSLHRQKSHFYAIFFLALHKNKRDIYHHTVTVWICSKGSCLSVASYEQYASEWPQGGPARLAVCVTWCYKTVILSVTIRNNMLLSRDAVLNCWVEFSIREDGGLG